MKFMNNFVCKIENVIKLAKRLFCLSKYLHEE
jgi:hypothetical protein